MVHVKLRGQVVVVVFTADWFQLSRCVQKRIGCTVCHVKGLFTHNNLLSQNGYPVF